MRNFDEATITDAVLQRVRAAKDDRIRQVSEALVRHLHAFVREIERTQAEWQAGIDFLTRTGQMCDDKRQEFMLLSDTLGVSILVAVSYRRFWFWSIKPAAYPIPHDGPVGKLLEVQGRHPWHPAHVHFMIAAPGHQTLVTHVFAAGDQYLDSDAVFGVEDSLIREFAGMPAGTTVDGREMAQPYCHLNYDFGLKADSETRRSGERAA
jgi:protocatechuate 3,4-dioxygenase beta subunit